MPRPPVELGDMNDSGPSFADQVAVHDDEAMMMRSSPSSPTTSPQRPRQDQQDNYDIQEQLKALFSKNPDMLAMFRGSQDTHHHIAKTFGAGNERIGAVAIAAALEEKQTKHLTKQLPDLFQQFKNKIQSLEASLKMDVPPTWPLVEDILHTYCRLVHNYAANKDPAPAAPTVHGGVCPQRTLTKVWRDSLPTESWERVFGSLPEVSWEKTFSETLTQLLDSFKTSVNAAAIYNDPGSRTQVLYEETPNLVEKLQNLGVTPEMREVHGDNAEKFRIKDCELARNEGKNLSAVQTDL